MSMITCIVYTQNVFNFFFHDQKLKRNPSNMIKKFYVGKSHPNYEKNDYTKRKIWKNSCCTRKYDEIKPSCGFTNKRFKVVFPKVFP